jgi:hypothetical protein
MIFDRRHMGRGIDMSGFDEIRLKVNYSGPGDLLRVSVKNSDPSYALPDGSAVGQPLVVNSQTLEVVGVVANEPETSSLAYAEVWLPLTAATAAGSWTAWVGDGAALLYVENPALREAMRDEYRRNVASFEGYVQNSFMYDSASSDARTAFELFAAQVTGRVSTQVLQRGGLGLAASGTGSVVTEFFAMSVIGGPRRSGPQAARPPAGRGDGRAHLGRHRAVAPRDHRGRPAPARGAGDRPRPPRPPRRA